MTDKEQILVAGALLHDIGKVVFRSGDKRKHSESGYDFLKNEAKIRENDLLDCVYYHHGDSLSRAALASDSLAYIVYIADNIAAATDRRESDGKEKGFDPNVPLSSIFNILNGNNGKSHYKPEVLDDQGKINMPTEKAVTYDSSFYKRLKIAILDSLKGVETWNTEHSNSLLSVMEAYLSYIPSSTALHELTDISLYDHLKMTAAYSSCIYQYLESQGEHNYKEILYKKSKAFYSRKAFRLLSMDISGIQKFIYTIHSEDALRTLRSRSFYLEVLMEHMVDEILEACDLTRANLLYSGGGHCYILLPNTEKIIKTIDEKEKEFNAFFLKNFDIALYVAMASKECSSENLKNEPEGSYSELFRSISSELSDKKSMRYGAAQIQALNARKHKENTRECRVCKNSSKLNDDNVCTFCQEVIEFSKNVLYQDFFTVTTDSNKHCLPLSGDKYLIAQSESEVQNSMKQDSFVRTYGKNRFYTGKHVATKLWVGDYTTKSEVTGTGMTTDEYAKNAEGINRIAVFRADVDNLGKAFVSGLPKKYTTLSRTASFSRMLSLFFKHHINYILENGDFSLQSASEAGQRKATIIYSGGDDLFLIGSWNDVIELAVDIREEFGKYSQGTMTLSGGIGIYPAKYPLSVTAEEVAELEDASKGYPNSKNPTKDAITLFEDTYSWQEFQDNVVCEKLDALEAFFGTSDERGKAFLYRLLELIRNMDEKINLARFAYVLARLEPDKEKDAVLRESYAEFSRQMYRWVQDKTERRSLITAIYLYVYLHREGEDKS